MSHASLKSAVSEVDLALVNAIKEVGLPVESYVKILEEVLDITSINALQYMTYDDVKEDLAPHVKKPWQTKALARLFGQAFGSGGWVNPGTRRFACFWEIEGITNRHLPGIVLFRSGMIRLVCKMEKRTSPDGMKMQ